MPGIKELKTRIKSIQGTRKVTRAMQMVSAAKMRKAQDATMKSRTYSSLAWEMIGNLAPVSAIPENASEDDWYDDEAPIAIETESESDPESTEPVPGQFDNLKSSLKDLYKGMTHKEPPITLLMQAFPKAPKIAILILSTNRGMVGSLNTNLLATAEKEIDKFIGNATTTPSREAHHPSLKEEGRTASASFSPPAKEEYPRLAGGEVVKTVDIITYGRKGRDVMVRSHKEVLADFEKFDRRISPEDIFPIAELITNLYKTGNYQKVLIIYNHFVSTLVQKPTVKQLLPFAPAVIPEISSAAKKLSGIQSKPSSGSRLSDAFGRDDTATGYLFEPTPEAVIDHLIPRIIESQIYQTILESEASEQSARMVMMKNATEAAGDLISDYTLTYNQLRQNKITTELAEITAGKIALE